MINVDISKLPISLIDFHCKSVSQKDVHPLYQFRFIFHPIETNLVPFPIAHILSSFPSLTLTMFP